MILLKKKLTNNIPNRQGLIKQRYSTTENLSRVQCKY